MTQAGLSYMSRKYADEHTMGVDTKKSLEIIHLRGTLAVNLRPYTKIEDLADMMTKGAKYAWGNFVGVVRFPLWVRSEADSLEYVRRARATMDRKILSLEAFNFYGVIKFTMNFFGEKVVQAVSKRLYDHTTLTYSSVMGPNEDISIFDHPILYVAASALTGSQVFNIHIVSYVNKIIISLAVDATVIPDPHRLCDDMVESLNIIKSAALERGSH
ncbi:O-acyltransferase WSD1 C-terminal, partial [Arabidopsis suecica]